MARTPDTKVDVYKNSFTPRELALLRRTLAKRANQRLVRLERAKSKITGERYAGIGASEQIYDYLERTRPAVKGGVSRFSEKLDSGMTYEQIQREVTTLQGFLESKSSLVSGLRDIERKRISTFESGKWGSSKVTGKSSRKLLFSSTKEFYDFIHTKTFRDLIGMGFTSEQIIEAYDSTREKYQGSDKEAQQALEDALETFREKGRGTLKELREVGGKKPVNLMAT